MAEVVLSRMELNGGDLVLELIGEGDFVPDPLLGPDDNGRFVGKVVGYRWQAKDRQTLDRYDFIWTERGERQPPETRTGAAGERRTPTRRDRSEVRLDVVRREGGPRGVDRR